VQQSGTDGGRVKDFIEADAAQDLRAQRHAGRPGVVR